MSGKGPQDTERSASGNIRRCARLLFGCERIEIDKLRIVGRGFAIGVSAAVNVDQGLHAPRIEVIDVLMP